MTRRIDDSHDPGLRSWVESANRPEAEFPIQNLPFGIFRPRGRSEPFRIGVAIGDFAFDLKQAGARHLLDELRADVRDACGRDRLNGLMTLGPAASAALRRQLVRLLRTDARRADADVLIPLDAIEMALPADIGDYTDFYASIFHATRVGMLVRRENPLLPNYRHVPIAYHGRASSVVVSGTPVRRPWGQSRQPEQPAPSFEPTRALDFEVEVGLFVGQGNTLGRPIAIDDAEDYLFGCCLLNDWSARDIQSWEYQPLGPFLSKSFATTISPWVITLEALAPFRCETSRPPADPSPLPYLQSTDATSGGLDIRLELHLQSARMRELGMPAVLLARTSFREMYWSVAQMVAHHTSNGCNLRPGDLIGSGTVSGSTADSLGCLLEITRRGAEPLVLPSGETRSYLADGDEVVLRGWCERDGYVRIGLGKCRGTVVPAVESYPLRT